MIKIDWRMVPEWADGHGLISWQGITEVWINADQYAVVGREGGPYPWGGGTGDTRHNHSRGQVQYITRRPDRWDGEGIPPVGVNCEARIDCEWEPATVVAHDLGCAIVRRFTECEIQVYDAAGSSQLRPIRTLEQIEAEERRKTIEEMVSASPMLDKGWARKVCTALYDAGYRKQEAS